ncbi:uncharacterized protein [Triticum aestivum]|uniref:uncharacterized protein isoform X2 n=1 Tax=Triticum aestivum TaxID=4565 RepID=UPI001D012C03|nr:uncharacterized protein LOC123188462 isoform X2 [Triticum aestivum]
MNSSGGAMATNERPAASVDPYVELACSRGPSPPSVSPEPPPYSSLLGRGVLALGVGACGTDAIDDKELHLVHHKDGQRHIKGCEPVMHRWTNLVYEKETYASALFSSFRVPPTDTSTCSGQRGPVGAMLFNPVKPGSHVAQMIVQVIMTPKVAEVEDLDAGGGGIWVHRHLNFEPW